MCKLKAGSEESDANTSDLTYGLFNADTLNAELVHTFTGTGSATIDCNVLGGTWGTLGARIVAIKVGSGVQQNGN